MYAAQIRKWSPKHRISGPVNSMWITGTITRKAKSEGKSFSPLRGLQVDFRPLRGLQVDFRPLRVVFR